MNIIYIHQHFATISGAGGIRSYKMARQLVADGHKVTVICGHFDGASTGLRSPFVKGARSGQVDGINVVEFHLPYGNSMGYMARALIFARFILKASRHIFRQNADVVFATSTPLSVGLLTILARLTSKATVVFEVRDLWPELPQAMGVITNRTLLFAMRLLEWGSYHSAHRLIGLSPGMVEGIERRGIQKNRIALIPNGADNDIFGPSVKPIRPTAVGKDDFVAMFAGTLGTANGVDALLDAAAELKRRQNEKLKIVLVGNGRDKSKLEERATREGLDNVIFHESVPKLEVAQFLRGADVGLQCLANVPAFYFGTSPNKFFDYLASGIPVVTNYPGWVANLIDTHQCGIAVPPENPLALADALENLQSDREGRLVMGRNARQLAETEFDRTVLATRWVGWVISGQRIDRYVAGQA